MRAEQRWWRTLRFRVTVVAALAVVVVLGATSALLISRQRANLLDQLDEALHRDADRIAAAIAAGATPSLPALGDDDITMEIRAADGTVVASSPRFDDGAGHRAVTRSARGADGFAGTIVVASPVDDVDEAVDALIRSLALIVPLAVVALVGIVWFVTGRTLRPVERIRSEVAGIGPRELDRRVPEPRGDDEIARLAATMNEMLDRLEQASRRQQRFVADASHELRTPLTRMRSELEVGTASTASLLQEITAQQRLIEDLLLLARRDAETSDDPGVDVDLDDVVLEEVRGVRPTSTVAIDVSMVSGAQVRGRRDELRRIVRNLLDNAVRHAATSVHVALVEARGTVQLTVRDDGAGIAPDRQAEVFERFARLDDARSGAAPRTGLGLAIAHDLAIGHGGTIAVVSSPGGGASFVVTLPASRPPR